MRLRPYQFEAVRLANEAIRQWRRLLIVMATGLGKTVVFCHLATATDLCDRTLILAHREELVLQAAQKAEAIAGCEVGIEMADRRVNEFAVEPPRIIVASIATIINRLSKFDAKRYRWRIVVDEAHHAVADSYTTIINHFLDGNPKSHLIGVTATPQRGDKAALGQVFDHVCYEKHLPEAIGEGWLVDVDQRVVHIEGLDFSKVRTTRGDLNESDLEAILKEEKILHQMAIPTLECANGRPGIVFCVSVHHAHLMADVLNRYKPGCALALDGKTEKKIERPRQIRRYQDGEIQFLVNCSLFLEGFDAPHTAVVSMGRPTKSIALYSQVLGRGTRPLPGVVDAFSEGTVNQRLAAIQCSAKPRMLMLDFAGNAGRHKIVSAVDVLGGKYDEEVRRNAAKAAAESKGEVRTAVQLEYAHQLIEAQKLLAESAKKIAEQKRARERERIKAQVEYSTRTVSPFQRWDVVRPTDHQTGPRHDPATPKQLALLRHKFKVSDDKLKTLSKKQAGAIIDSYMKKGAKNGNEG